MSDRGGRYHGVTTGLERYRLPYNALTQTRLEDVDLSTSFLGKRLRAPVLVGAMTGGAELSATINRNLAAAAQRLGIGMMLGSQRIMLNSALGEQAAASFAVCNVAPDVLLLGNIVVGADALAVHTIRCRRRCNATVTPTSPALLPGCGTSPANLAIRSC
jgi:isopentenyl diphosphate isomerase/L-lactate dehydrogenase-like FMN-dependent dehydrogenase